MIASPSLRSMWRIWSVYGVSSILSRSIAFLLLPLYTRVLTPEEYGIRAMVSLGLELTLLLVACGLKEALTRFYTADDARWSRDAAASTGLLTHAALIGLGVTLGLMAAPWLAGPLLGDAGLAHFLRLGFVAGFFMHIQEGAFVYLRARQEATTVAVASVAGLLAMIALNLLFVVGLRTGVAGIFYAEMIVYGLFGVALTVRALREVGVRFVPDLSRAMIRFGAPLMLLPFAWLFVTRADVMFLTHYGSLAAVGVYSLAVQCAQVLQIAVIYPFRHFWTPTQFQLNNGDGRRMFRRMFQWFTFTAIVAAFVCAVAANDLIRVMAAPVFHGAAVVVPIIILAYVLEAVHMFFNSALLVRDRTALTAVVALVTVGVNLGANALLVPPFLAVGAATARVIAMAVMVLTTFVLAQRLWPQHPDLRALATVGGWATLFFAVGWSLPDMPLVAAVAVKALLAIGLIAVSLWSGALEREDVALARGVIHAALAPRLRNSTMRWRTRVFGTSKAR